jgi:tetratricopeptide (TPR) repeat protein
MMVIQTIRRASLLALMGIGVMLSGCILFSPVVPPTKEEVLLRQLEEQRQQAVSLYVDAVMLNEINEYAAAIRKLELATELDRNFAVAFSMKGDLYQAEQKYDKSADAYERAATLDPWSFKDFFNLGKVSQILKQFTRAANAYVAAAKLDPQHYGAQIGAAQSYFELKDFEQSHQYAQKAKEIDPSQADPELLLGDIFEEQKEHLEAISAYRRALELQGNQPKVMVSLARAYLRTGRYSSAKELLTDVIATEPENAVAHQYLGFAQLKLKETQEAIDSYKRAVKFGKDDWMAHKSLGVAYMLSAMQNNNDEKIKALAVEQWTISLQINPDQPQLRELLSKYN